MGLKPLALEEWILRDEDFDSQVALKRDLLASARDVVFAFTPAANEAALELEAELRDHLVRTFPAAYTLEGDGLKVLATGETFGPSATGEQALLTVGRWVQEDFCLLAAEPPVLLTGGSVCFPSRWKIADKMGRDSAGIHGPVPRFQASIGTQTQNFLEKIQPARPMWRLNWTLHDSDELHCPEAHESRTDLTEANILDLIYLRIERQTLRRLPNSRGIVFTIRTTIRPLRRVLSDADRIEKFKGTILQLPEDVAHYKGMRAFFGTLRGALQGL
jgi:hypothetical protein